MPFDPISGALLGSSILSSLGNLGLGFGGGGTATSRSGTRTLPNPEFVNFTQRLGLGPLPIQDLYNISPRTNSLFGGRQGGFASQVNFMPPQTLTPPGTPQPGATPQQQIYTRNDIVNAFEGLGPVESQEKAADIDRFLFKGKNSLDPEGFTLEELNSAIESAKSKGASGRSLGNLRNAAANLETTSDVYATAAQPTFTRNY